MRSLLVEEALRQCWTVAWGDVARELEQEVSVGGAMGVMKKMMGFMQQVCGAGFRAWVEQADVAEDTLVRDGQTLRFQCASPKEFVTPCGPITVVRRLFQADRGGPVHVPIDEAWGMVGQFATPEVREAAVYLMALVPAAEAEDILRKTALFTLSNTTLKKLAAEFGEWIDERESLVAEVRAAETLPVETKVLCASLDGTNVRLNEPGAKLGRRPVGATDEPEKSSFKNAMVGTVSFYGAVPPDEDAPEHLQTRYTSHMPEAHFPTFRAKFEAERHDAHARCGPEVTRVLTLDASTVLWNYLESEPLYADFEKIVDFPHGVEHLALAAEALFGQGTAPAQAWLSRHRRTLLDHDDGPRRVIAAMAHAKRQRKLTKWAPAELSKQRTYFHNNRARMTYADFRARGLPIGSGPVEAAGKMLVKVRLCRSGMRWTRTGGQHILAARTLIKSNRWNAIWSGYLNSLQAT